MKNFLMIFALLCLVVNAQQEPLESDRPDLSESASAVSPGYLQVESGFQIQNSRDEVNGLPLNSRELSLLSTLIRYGILNGIELRLEAEYLYQSITALGSFNLEGISGLSLGTKIELVHDKINFPDAAVLIHFDLPLGNADFKPETVEPSAVFALAHALSERFDIAYNFGGSWDSDLEKIFFLYAVAVETPLTDRLGTFLEFFGQASSGNNFTKNIDGGFTYLLQDNFQADISAGIDLNAPKDNWFWGIGVSFRLPD